MARQRTGLCDAVHSCMPVESIGALGLYPLMTLSKITTMAITSKI
jgi:hypothetical protein